MDKREDGCPGPTQGIKLLISNINWTQCIWTMYIQCCPLWTHDNDVSQSSDHAWCTQTPSVRRRLDTHKICCRCRAHWQLSADSTSNSSYYWTVSAPDKVTAVPVRRNGNFQTPISVHVVRPKRCHTLSNPAHRQDYMVACLNYTLQMMMPLPGWPVMAPNAYDNNNNCNE